MANLAYEFEDMKFMTADQQRWVLVAWERFLRLGCQWRHFTKALYEHLTLHCSFLPHGDRQGFYNRYFACLECRNRFLDQFDGRLIDHSRLTGDPVAFVPKSVEFPSYSWGRGPAASLNRAMVEMATPHIQELRSAPITEATGKES